eukprot:Transcript_19431.p1 GENE.Transcript_19431~~Transcript_19431.p1  ORF type:complete len:401 (-),score=97.08 Transcript_19431:122-1324(-)
MWPSSRKTACRATRATRAPLRRLCLGSPPSLLSLSLDEAARLLGGGSSRAKEVWSMIRRGESPLCEAAAARLPARTHVRAQMLFSPPTHTVTAEAESACGTHKLLLRLEDGLEVETVVIPMRGEADGRSESSGARSTLCLSSQVGCAQACRFCATGRMGRKRSLRAEEILAQVYEGAGLARRLGLPAIRNAVFMGMGEPLDNCEAVEHALDVMTHQHGFSLAPRHVTLSTVAPSVEAVRRLRQWPARPAWSLHAADDRLRKMLVPSARHRVAALRDAFAEVQEATRRPLLVECTLIRGVNDQAEHARQLVALLQPLARVKVNLIPYNRNLGLGSVGDRFEPSPAESVDAFRRLVVEAGLFCSVRRQRGAESAAACGMLATAQNRRTSPRDENSVVRPGRK